MARKRTPDVPPEEEGQMPTASPKGSRHRPRVTLSLTPGVNEVIQAHARESRQPIRWAAHDLLLRQLVAIGRITQAEADALWADLTRQKSEE